jgi:hypothetical protein
MSDKITVGKSNRFSVAIHKNNDSYSQKYNKAKKLNGS